MPPPASSPTWAPAPQPTYAPQPTPSPAFVPQAQVGSVSPQIQRFASPPFAGGGRPRNFLVVVLLGLVTFGIYFLVWQYQTFREVDRASGQEHGKGLFIASIVLQFFLYVPGVICQLVYFYSELNKVGHARLAAGMTRGMSGGRFILYGIAAYVGVSILMVVLIVPVMKASIVGGFLLAVLSVVALLATPYYFVQRSINQYWTHIGVGPIATAPRTTWA